MGHRLRSSSRHPYAFVCVSAFIRMSRLQDSLEWAECGHQADVHPGLVPGLSLELLAEASLPAAAQGAQQFSKRQCDVGRADSLEQVPPCRAAGRGGVPAESAGGASAVLPNQIQIWPRWGRDPHGKDGPCGQPHRSRDPYSSGECPPALAPKPRNSVCPHPPESLCLCWSPGECL